MADVNALYPQPPAQQQQQPNALLSDPTRAISLLSGIQDYRLKQQQFDALAQQPGAALQGQNIQNTTAQRAQDEAGTQIAAHYLGTLPDNATTDDVNRMKMAIRATHPNITAETINSVADLGTRDPKGLKNGIATWRTIGLSPESMVSRVTGTPSATGAPTQQPMTTAIRNGVQETDLPPGEKGLLEGPVERANRLQSTATTSPQYHADLENLRQESKVLGNVGGPTTETEKKVNQMLSRFGVEGTMTKEQLGAAESFAKIANQISLNQSTMFHGSDAGLHTVVSANPSLEQSRYGREGIIDMLHGNQDAIDVTRKAWLKARALGAPANSYDMFAEQMGEKIDPRVFQFNRLSRDNQQKFLSQMDPADLPDFEKRYQESVKQKWVKPLKAPESGK